MELAASVQDYVIVHELCHTVEKNQYEPSWILGGSPRTLAPRVVLGRLRLVMLFSILCPQHLAALP